MAGTLKRPAAEGDLVPPRPARKCPTCGRPSVRAFTPFCSKRCANIDLNRWLSGAYAIAAVEDEPGGEDESGSEG